MSTGCVYDSPMSKRCKIKHLNNVREGVCWTKEGPVEEVQVYSRLLGHDVYSGTQIQCTTMIGRNLRRGDQHGNNVPTQGLGRAEHWGQVGRFLGDSDSCRRLAWLSVDEGLTFSKTNADWSRHRYTCQMTDSASPEETPSPDLLGEILVSLADADNHRWTGPCWCVS